MNIIIAGDGEVGLHLAKELADENHDITIVDPHEDLLKMVESHTDLMTITGDSTSISVLQRANVKKADLLISVVHDEQINIITAILGKKLGAKKTIARVNSLENLSKENLDIYNSLGIDSLVCPEEIAANEIINLLKQTAATEIFEFSEGALSLFLIKLEENAPALRMSLNDIVKEHPHLNFRAVAIHRNSRTIIPKGDDMFLPNDLSYVITKPEGVEDLLKVSGKTEINIQNIMVVGGGRVGRTACKLLENEVGIKLFEVDKEKCITLTDILEETLVINGDARDIQLLEEEDIRGVDAFIAVTNNSETNILTCLHARKFGVKKTIALVENIDYIDISQNIGIDTIINKKLITASYIVKFTMGSEVTSLKCLSGIDAEAMELVAKPKSSVTKKPIHKLNIPKGAIIGGVIRGNESHIATGDFQIQEGDKVVVFMLPEAISKVDKLFN
ncbi:MAG: Trk system potassium transporter TrkA [Bacteroidetes bacterium]|nr:Trk system potassium transporter TrkA [Bacteroidota bacterium]